MNFIQLTRILYFLYRRNKLWKLQFESFKVQLNEKQFVSKSLGKKIEKAQTLHILQYSKGDEL